jgi:hypothetical protein
MSGFNDANNACPQCAHKPYNGDTVKPSTSSRRSVKAWLKSEKAKADEQAAATEKVIETTSQPPVNGLSENDTKGHDHIEVNGTEPATTADEVMASVEVCPVLLHHQTLN